ncbi:MAG: hydrogenase maturation peptidase HycI [Elusimicrobia bacterium]|nr:hydrogenase maturation peptidase HycI [Elusimicrobiota bacterium]
MKFDIKDVGRGNVLIVGIGNSLKGDDGAGCEVIKQLEGKTNYKLLDVGSAPENYTKKIKEFCPDTIIFIDAVEMKEKPGTIKIIDEKEISSGFFTTHNMPLNLFLDYIKEQTKAKIIFIGIQPKSMKFGDKISPPVKKAIEKLTNILQERD